MRLDPLLVAAIAHAAVGCSSTPPKPASGFVTTEHVPYPEIPTGGGPTLAAAQIITVSFASDPHAVELKAFVDWLGQSDWLPRATAEYGVRSIERGAHVDLPGAAASSLTDDDVRGLLTSNLQDGTIPAAPASSPTPVYVLFFPNGTFIAHGDLDACSDNPGNGYHEMIDPSGPAYVVVPSCYPRFSNSTVAGMELETARLLVDALTDPFARNEPAYVLTDNSNPWMSLGSEVGDFCWGRLVTQGPGYPLQRVWSNKAAAKGVEPCVPAPTGTVPFGVTATPSGLQELQVGAPLTFAVTGWSEGPVPDWSIQATHWVGDYAVEAVVDRATLNNGQTATLRVTLPYPVPSGTYGAVVIQSVSGRDRPWWPVAFVVH